MVLRFNNKMLKENELRYKRVNTCKECLMKCNSCGTGIACGSVKKQLREYSGVRFTSDGFDCALPVSIDSHSVCSFGCLYCFAPNLIQRREEQNKMVGQTSLEFIESIFSGKGGRQAELFRKGLKYDRKVNGYPCPVQLGALTDPLDNIERHQGWFLKFVEIAKKYNQPVRISTKGNLFLEEEYLNALADKPELFWVAYSIITPDDKIIKQIDKRAPPTSERIECMKRLNEIGVKTSLRFRPIIAGISDSTEDYPFAYRDLIDMSADAGAKAISYEVCFLSGMMTEDIKRRWLEIEKIAKKPLIKIYKSFGKNQACIRPSYKWTEQIMHAIYKHAKKRNLTVGVSDPCWKQLNETGCCCGILPDDKVFGNWQRESATNQLLELKEGRKKEICSKDIIPNWANDVLMQDLVNVGVGPLNAFKHRHGTWADKLKEMWNDLSKERSPLHYFQGAIVPSRKENGEIYFKYKGLKRTFKKTPYWNIKDEI